MTKYSLVDVFCYDNYYGQILAAIIIACNFFISFIVGLISVRYIQKMDKLNKIIKYLFYLTWIGSFLAEMSHFVAIFGCIQSNNAVIEIFIFRGVHIIIYQFVLFAILLTLIARLYFTFQHSIYKPSNFHIFILCLLLIMILIAGITFAIGEFIFVTSWNYLMGYAALIASILYTVTTAYAVTLFVHNLMKLVKARANSAKNVLDESALKLNKTQTKFINQTARYVSLLTLATLSSIATLLGIFVNLISDNLLVGYALGLHISFDTSVNMILLCLQYPFANTYFDRYCQCTNRFWTYALMSKAQRSMQYKYRKSLQLTNTPNTNTPNDESNYDNL